MAAIKDLVESSQKKGQTKKMERKPQYSVFNALGVGIFGLIIFGMFAIQSYDLMKSGLGLGPTFYGFIFLLMISCFGLLLFGLIARLASYFKSK